MQNFGTDRLSKNFSWILYLFVYILFDVFIAEFLFFRFNNKFESNFDDS